MAENIKIIFGLLGGVGIFIFGMNFMSDGLKKVAGEKMRRILAVLTKNPLIAVLMGALVTAVLQSSSATTVMVVGFVSAGLMTLRQSIGVIMGANIGTTITAQLIAFNIGDYVYLFVAVGFILYFFINKKIIKYIGQTIFGFGLLFVGLNTMSQLMKPLAQSPIFENLILQLSELPVLGVLIGTAMTVVVQSSSATIAVLQNLASQPGTDGVSALLSLTTAIPILFGDNIGTTITSVLACIGAKREAKRTALVHSIFNISGTLIFIWFVPTFAKVVEFISPKGPEVEVISRQIANAHSLFNITNTIIWLPMIGVLAKVVTWIIRGSDDTPYENRVVYLDNKILSNAALAMNLATKELSRMAEMSKEMMISARAAFIDNSKEAAAKVDEIEDIVDMLQAEITRYLSAMLSVESLTDRQSIRLAGLMHVASDIERIGDHCQNISELATTKIEKNIEFSEESFKDIEGAFVKLTAMVETTIAALEANDISLAKKVEEYEDDIDDLEDNMRYSNIAKLNDGLSNPEATIMLIELVHNVERIADHCCNISEAVIADSAV